MWNWFLREEHMSTLPSKTKKQTCLNELECTPGVWWMLLVNILTLLKPPPQTPSILLQSTQSNPPGNWFLQNQGYPGSYPNRDA